MAALRPYLRWLLSVIARVKPRLNLLESARHIATNGDWANTYAQLVR